MIVKQLKHVTFSWDEIDQTLLITPVPLDYGVRQYILSKVEAGSLARFIFSRFQYNKKGANPKAQKKQKDKTEQKEGRRFIQSSNKKARSM